MTPDFILENYAVADVETTTRNGGNVYDPRNKLCYVGIGNSNTSDLFSVDLGGNPYGDVLLKIQRKLSESRTIVGFNLKFDLNWLRRYACRIGLAQRVFDLQTAFFILRGQDRKFAYPSLDQVLEYYGLPPKDHNIEENYWNKGIDTDQIPKEEMLSYLGTDVIREDQVLQCVLDEMKRNTSLHRLIWLSCQDEVVTAEIEWNGLKYDRHQSLRKSELLDLEIEGIDQQLKKLLAVPYLNWNSNDHISAALYGGTFKYRVRERYWRTLKSGETKEGEHWVDKEEHLPRLVEPLRGSELKKKGYFATNEKTLKSLKAQGVAKEIIKLILKRSKLEKANGTYFKGLPNKIDEFGWEDDILHPTLNHCVAATGRLSSSNPNSQNLDEQVRACIVSRF